MEKVHALVEQLRGDGHHVRDGRGGGKYSSGISFTRPSSFIVSGSDVCFGDGVEAISQMLGRLALDPDKGAAKRVPKSFVKLQKILRRKGGYDGLVIRGNPKLSLVRVEDVQEASGLDEFSLPLALSLLHDVGVILWYEICEPLREYDSANPTWIVDVVGRAFFRHDIFNRPETDRSGVLYDLKSPSRNFPLAKLPMKLEKEQKLDEGMLNLFPVRKKLDAGTFRICVNLMQEFDLMYSLPRPRSGDPIEYLVPLFLRSGFHPKTFAPQRQSIRSSLSCAFNEANKKLTRQSGVRSERLRVNDFFAFSFHMAFSFVSWLVGIVLDRTSRFRA